MTGKRTHETFGSRFQLFAKLDPTMKKTLKKSFSMVAGGAWDPATKKQIIGTGSVRSLPDEKETLG